MKYPYLWHPSSSFCCNSEKYVFDITRNDTFRTSIEILKYYSMLLEVMPDQIQGGIK